MLDFKAALQKIVLKSKINNLIDGVSAMEKDERKTDRSRAGGLQFH